MWGHNNLYGIRYFIRGTAIVWGYETLLTVRQFIWGTKICMGVLQFIWEYDSLCGDMIIYMGYDILLGDDNLCGRGWGTTPYLGYDTSYGDGTLHMPSVNMFHFSPNLIPSQHAPQALSPF